MYFRFLGLTVAALVASSAPGAAQVQAGNTQLSLDGSVSVGYSGSYGNEASSTIAGPSINNENTTPSIAGSSSHGILTGGTGNLSGSYYSPQFLNFDVMPFFNQSRNSSSFNSVLDSSGVIARANFFGGSPFPGYISYTRVFNSESDYSLPGQANFKTNGNNQTLGLGWSLNLHDLPTLQVGYQQGTSDTSLYGAQSDSLTDFHSLFAITNYTVAGFHLNGGIHYTNGSSTFPELVAGEPIENTNSSTTAYTFNVTRSTLWQGSTWANFTRTDTSYDSAGISSSENADLLSAGIVMKPTKKLSVQLSGDYNDNLAGTIFQQANSAGAISPVSVPAGTSHSWDVFLQSQYLILQGLYVGGSVAHRQQEFLGSQYDSNDYSGSLGFGHELLGGQFNSSGVVTYNSQSYTNQSLLGFISNASYIRKFGAWHVSGSFNYSENVQSFLIEYTTSSYGYSGTLGRRIGRLNWTGSAGGSKSLLSQEQGTNTTTQNYSTALGGRWLGASAGYSKSDGTGLSTATGIVPLPTGVPVQFLPTVTSFNGTTYSAGLGSNPIRGLTFNGSYVHATYTTTGVSNPSHNKTEQTNLYLLYKVRKIDFTAGYTRLLQSFSATGVAGNNTSTFYFAISRWFKFF